MPPPSIGPLIPSPKDDFGEAAKAAKKAAMLAAAVGAAVIVERRFPKTTGPVVRFVTGLETVPGKGIKIKPGFVAWAAPQPIGLTPPRFVGLPDIFGDPLNMYKTDKVKESYDRLQKEKAERDFAAIHRVITEAEPALRERPIAFVATAKRKVQLALEKLGPPEERILVITNKRSPVDERLFLTMMNASLDAELARRQEAHPELMAIDLRPPKKDGGSIGIVEESTTDSLINPVLLALGAIDAFFGANPADP